MEETQRTKCLVDMTSVTSSDSLFIGMFRSLLNICAKTLISSTHLRHRQLATCAGGYVHNKALKVSLSALLLYNRQLQHNASAFINLQFTPENTSDL